MSKNDDEAIWEAPKSKADKKRFERQVGLDVEQFFERAQLLCIDADLGKGIWTEGNCPLAMYDHEAMVAALLGIAGEEGETHCPFCGRPDTKERPMLGKHPWPRKVAVSELEELKESVKRLTEQLKSAQYRADKAEENLDRERNERNYDGGCGDFDDEEDDLIDRHLEEANARCIELQDQKDRLREQRDLLADTVSVLSAMVREAQ